MVSERAARRLLARRLAGAGLGVVADECLGEPPLEPHPVAVFGAVMRGVERIGYRDRRTAGAAHAALGAIFGGAAGAAVGSTVLGTYLAVAGRGLREAAEAVAVPLRAGDVEGAREMLPALVGRDASELDAAGIVRAVVESVAENTVDAVVAPAFWAVVAGAPGVLAYRAVNTMDAMVGHHSDRYEHYGWAAARLDDGANLVPARLTAALVAGVRPHRSSPIARAVTTQARAHPSPNAGVAEAAFAAALGVRLGGPISYGGRGEVRPQLGEGPPAGERDIGRAVRLSRHVGVALAAGLLAAAGALIGSA